MAAINFTEKMEEVQQRIKVPEECLATGLMQPFTNTNSGPRKIMFAIQLSHALSPLRPEVPIVQTGFENRFGDRSASIVKADSDFEVVDKISKFSDKPQHHYFLITKSHTTNALDVLERISYKHSTESYGYLYNNSALDNLDIGYEVPKDELLRKSLAFDVNNNRCDGVNLLTAYICRDKTMEDGIQISQSAAEKLSIPLIREVEVSINDNDIPLNLYGGDEIYKSFPNIGEHIQGGILCSIRREKIEESLFSQSYERLKNILMSDEKYTPGHGKILDIDIFCNSPDKLDKYTNTQLKYYYDEKIRFMTEFTTSVENMMKIGYTNLSSKLDNMYNTFKQELNGGQYMGNKLFTGTIIKFIVMEENIPSVGDKISNRYGGKGVIAEVVEDELMPETDSGETVELIMNSSTCINRENAGQLFETSLTHIGARIIEFIKMNALDTDESIDMVVKFVSMCAPLQGYYLKDTMDRSEPEERDWFIQNLIDEGNIMLSIRPVSESMDIDRLKAIYDEFPWAVQYKLTVPIKDSNGNIRYIEGRRPLTCGKMYIYRLKQYAEEKFSVTSLSSTNIRNENARNKANKAYKSLHQNTPIKFGDMETGDMAHIGMEYVIANLMTHSVSPQARRLVEKIYTEDAYNVDIKLDSNSVNRNAEILNVYLKTIGLRLTFHKKYKKLVRPFLVRPIHYEFRPPLVRPFTYISEEEKNFDPNKDAQFMIEQKEQIDKRAAFYYPVDYEDHTRPDN